MNPSPKTSAAAASDSYLDLRQSDVTKPKKVFLDGAEYTVFGYKDDPVTGFQATAYQNTKTNEVIIAYRGTDTGHLLTGVQDAAVDATMVRDRINPQEAEARAFTQQMLDKAHSRGISKDQITVAGHSLGGTLAEIEASKFGLHGVTLNAYGAIGLGYDVPEGGNQVTNYVMAGDPVSAASHHFGRVIPLASPEDLKSLQKGRYLDAPAGSEPPNPLIAMRLDDHSVTHFTGKDGALNVLSPAVMAQYEKNYADHKDAFDHLRGDIYRERTELGQVLRQNLLHDGYGPAVHLPPEIHRQLNEYLAVNVDPSIKQGIEHNGTVKNVENRLHYGAGVFRAAGEWIQTQDDRMAQGVLHASVKLADAAPFVPLAGAAVATWLHGDGQAAHATGSFAARHLESAEQSVKDAAHRVTRGVEATIHSPGFQAGAAKAVGGVVDTYGHVERAKQSVEHIYDQARRSLSHGIDAAERDTSHAYDTLTHPGKWFGHPSDSSRTAPAAAAPAPARASEPKAYTGDHHVDRLIAALDDPAAFKQAMTHLTNSPDGEAFRAQGRALHVETQNQQLRQQLSQQQTQAQPQLQQGPVMSH